jgi:hypothetical protein
MVYVGVGGDIEGKVNPTLMVHEGVCTAVRKPSSGAPAFVPARAA